MRLPHVLVSIAALAACEKSEAPKTATAPATSDTELALLAQLPAAPIALGGNYAKLQGLQSLFDPLATTIGDQMKRWMDCSLETTKTLKSVGVLTLTGEPTLRFVSTGMSFSDIVKCAMAAGFRSTEDADKKYLVIEFPARGKTFTQSYLALPNGAVYMRQMLGSRATMTRTQTRAELEADVAAVKKGSTAADDATLQRMIAKVDRSKGMWVAGTAAGTPLADKVGEVYGTLDVGPGLTVDANVQLANEELGTRVDETWSQMKQNKDQMPAELAGIIGTIKLDRSGDRVHFAMTLDDAQLKSVVQRLGRAAGGM